MKEKPEYITAKEVLKTKSNIAFIGFMGTGKTTVGKILAHKTGLRFVDTDRLIIEKVGLDISSIFNQYGETYFRDLEEEILKQVLSQEGQIISCGGGIIIRESNRNILKERAINCWLYNSPEISISRFKSSDRPLLKTEDPLATAKLLMEERTSLYQEVADLRLNTEEFTIDQIVTIFYEHTYQTFFC